MSHKAKLLILTAVCGILTLTSFATAITGSETDKNLIRFHVIANSDSAFDQSVKLAVRDRVIDEVNTILADAENVLDAEKILNDHRDELIVAANAVLAEHQCDYSADAVLGTSVFPTKSYGDLTLPAGKYNAFRIILGEGKGKNWWCVLYPPLCFVDIKDDTAVAVTTTEEFHREDGDVFAVDGNLFQIKVKSKLLEFLQ
ncbi:MAG: stage II sporulation protein R [Firmicutes bacterium]|nr:stage II sporulation protein R [Bacillota bacterium]